MFEDLIIDVEVVNNFRVKVMTLDEYMNLPECSWNALGM